MQNTFDNFKNNFQARFDNHSILTIGEDSVRYDFFIAFMQDKELHTHQIQVEYPVHPNAYIPRAVQNAKRNENPLIDLYTELVDTKLTAEFGLFKRNSNPNGQVNTTEKQFKLLNDLLRLSLNKVYNPNESFFICVADSSIIGVQMRGNILPQFPANNYNFSYIDINNWIATRTSAKTVFDQRFVDKANQIQLVVESELIYNQQLLNPIAIPNNNLLTRVLVYKIKNLKWSAHNISIANSGA